MLEEHPLTSPELTGDWEKRLTDIEHGTRRPRRVHRRASPSFTRATVEQIAALDKEKLRPERVELGLCPRCGAETGEIIRENSKAYGCTSWKSREETGCGFVIWKRVAGRTITPEIARQLIEEGRDQGGHLRLPSRAGKPFRARLVLNGEGKVEFELPGAERKPKRPLSRNNRRQRRTFVCWGRARQAGSPWTAEDNPPTVRSSRQVRRLTARKRTKA